MNQIELHIESSNEGMLQMQQHAQAMNRTTPNEIATQQMVLNSHEIQRCFSYDFVLKLLFTKYHLQTYVAK